MTSDPSWLRRAWSTWQRVELLTNNPDEAALLRAAGVHVDRCHPTGLHLSFVNGQYLRRKPVGATSCWVWGESRSHRDVAWQITLLRRRLA